MKVHVEVQTIDKVAIESFLPDEKKYDTPLLFVHGSSCGSWVWANFTSYFSSRGWTCHVLNLRGHHLSPPIDDWADVGVEEYLEDVDRAVQMIDDTFILIGHSMGGVLAQKYAETKNPEKLILLHTSPPIQVVQKIDFSAFLKRGKEKGRIMGEKVLESDGDPNNLIGYMFDEGNVDDDVLEMTHKKMGKESSRAIIEMQKVNVDNENVRCPVYVLGFNLEKLGIHYPVNLSEELARYYQAADYRIIEPGGHMFMLEKNWEEFADVIGTWLKE